MTKPASIDSSGKPGINPPGVMFRLMVNTCPLLAIVMLCVFVTLPLLKVAE